MKVIGLILCVCTGCTYVTSQMLPPPTAIFPYRTFLDNARNVILRWNFNDTHIAFELIANTLGYVGFGISESRKMYPADIFVAYVKNDIVYYAVSIIPFGQRRQNDIVSISMRRHNNSARITSFSFRYDALRRTGMDTKPV